jgi:hypothetical protein
VTEVIGHKGVCHCRVLMVGEVVHSDQEISVPYVALRERFSDVNCDPLKGCSDVVLVHQEPTSGSGTSTCGTVVTLFTSALEVTL